MQEAWHALHATVRFSNLHADGKSRVLFWLIFLKATKKGSEFKKLSRGAFHQNCHYSYEEGTGVINFLKGSQPRIDPWHLICSWSLSIVRNKHWALLYVHPQNKQQWLWIRSKEWMPRSCGIITTTSDASQLLFSPIPSWLVKGGHRHLFPSSSQEAVAICAGRRQASGRAACPYRSFIRHPERKTLWT